MTLTIPSSRFAAMLADAEDAIAADAFVVLRFEDPVQAPINHALAGAGREAMESVTPLDSDRLNGTTILPSQATRPPRDYPRAAESLRPVKAPLAQEPRGPWWRTERLERRRGAWMEWQQPREQRTSAWRQWLAAAAFAYLAAHVVVWVLR